MSIERYSGFKLLIVDDNEQNLYTLRTLLHQHMDVEILEATGGEEAIEMALANPDIDLIILDVQMPEVDGFQTAKMLKIRKKTCDIPIIFLTAAVKTEEFQKKGYAVGAVDYLLKPIDDNQLINKISTYFRLIEKERSLNQVLEEKVLSRTAELARTTLHLEDIISNMGEALIILSADGKITRVNPAALMMLGYAENEMLGMTMADIFEEQDEDQAGAFMGTWLEALIRSGALKDIEAAFIAKNGRRIEILFSRTLIENAGGETDEIICIAKNMTGYQKLSTETVEED